MVYLNESNGGGIAEYSIRQVQALRAAGENVVFVCRPEFPVERLGSIEVREVLPMEPATDLGKIRKLFARIRDSRKMASVAAEIAREEGSGYLLWACFSEYFSPFWAGILRKAAREGITIGVVAHDPVRDFQLGPGWWHRWSVRQAYSFVRHVFVHDETEVDYGGGKPKGIQEHVIPHGPFALHEARQPREELREAFGFAADDVVFLAFGQIRNGKNLDRFLRAMVELPVHVKLLVAGKGAGRAQKPPKFYQELAGELGVADRCRWEVRYIPDEETGDLYEACDHVLIPYSAKFRSASGVMNVAARARRTMLVSSGPSPLQTAVREYDLGVFVEPDHDEKILRGAREMVFGSDVSPEWGRYEREHSWQENARRVVEAIA